MSTALFVLRSGRYSLFFEILDFLARKARLMCANREGNVASTRVDLFGSHFLRHVSFKKSRMCSNLFELGDCTSTIGIVAGAIYCALVARHRITHI